MQHSTTFNILNMLYYEYTRIPTTGRAQSNLFPVATRNQKGSSPLVHSHINLCVMCYTGKNRTTQQGTLCLSVALLYQYVYIPHLCSYGTKYQDYVYVKWEYWSTMQKIKRYFRQETLRYGNVIIHCDELKWLFNKEIHKSMIWI